MDKYRLHARINIRASFFFLKLSQLVCSDNYILTIRKPNHIDSILFGHMAKKLEAMMEYMR